MKTKTLGRMIWGFAGCVFLIMFISSFFVDDPMKAPPASEKKTPRPLTTQRQLTWKDEQFSDWNGSHHKTVQYVKNRMHNPKSFEHVETGFRDYATEGYRIIVMKYRGTNLFNAVITNIISVKVNLSGDVMSELKLPK